MNPHKESTSLWRGLLKYWYIHLFLLPISLPIVLIVFLNKKGYINFKLSSLKSRWFRLTILWLFTGIFALTLYAEPDYAYQVWIGFALLTLGIWIHPLKGEKFFENRIGHFKKHKKRLGLTVGALLVAVVAFVPVLQEEMAYRAEMEQEAFIDNYPEPEIEVISDEENQGDSTEYELVVEAKDATSVRANTKTMTQDDQDEEVFRLTVPLDSIENRIKIVAKNEHKEDEETILITRNENEQEKEERLALEAEQEELLLLLQKEEDQRLAEEAQQEQLAEEAEEEAEISEDEPVAVVSETVSQKNAVRSAQSYLDYSAFSYDGLVEQLKFEGFSHDDAVYGVDRSNADWNEQAAKSAEAYLDYSAFSRSSLIEQLKYEGFTQAQAEYGADAVGI